MTGLHVSFVGYQPMTSVHTRAAQVFERALRNELGGELEFGLENNVAESGLKAADCLSLVESGERTFCYFASSYSAHRFPEIAILDLPFLVSDRDRAYQALDGDFGDALKEIVRAGSDYELLGFWDNGFRHLSNRARPIRAPADCAGLRIRTGDSQLHQDTFAALGFEPTFIDVADLAAAVERGDVDAQDNPLSNIFNFGIHQHHRYITLSGHFLGFVTVLCHGPTYKSWDATTKAAVHAALVQATEAQRGFAQAEDNRVLGELAKTDNEVVELSDAERRAFVDAVQPVIEAQMASLDGRLVELYLGASA
ncbi:MAG: TRAP transporter substrate-binding protein DctP [Alphaproteobacteria bacterium]|nr:TRAP transporter substrate-binding protein DctP [Alphaproteobacteria bacterium]